MCVCVCVCECECVCVRARARAREHSYVQTTRWSNGVVFQCESVSLCLVLANYA